MDNGWKDNLVQRPNEEGGRRWYVRVCPKDERRESAIEMWRWLEGRGVKKEWVERINDHSFKVWVKDKELGELIKAALEERYGK